MSALFLLFDGGCRASILEFTRVELSRAALMKTGYAPAWMWRACFMEIAWRPIISLLACVREWLAKAA